MRIALLLFLMPIVCWAWGFQGHRIIADIAEKRLTPTTRTLLKPIQYLTRLQQLSIWPDTIRHYQPHTVDWHYTTAGQSLPNMPPTFKAPGHLPQALCQQFQLLTTPTTQHWQKRHEALSWVIHLVGDAHQPLHINQKDDSGANRCQVRWLNQKKRFNLHQVWDTLLVKTLPKSLYTHDSSIPDTVLARAPTAWLTEAMRLHTFIYPKPHKPFCRTAYQHTVYPYHINKYYIHTMQPIVAHQLQLAGQRLAYWLNDLLDSHFRETHPALQAWPGCVLKPQSFNRQHSTHI